MQGELSSPSMGSHKIYFSSRTGDASLKKLVQRSDLAIHPTGKGGNGCGYPCFQVLGSSTKEGFFDVGQPANISRSHLLRVDFKMASGKDVSAQYCFDLRDEVLTEIENGQTKEFSVAGCGGEV